MYEFHVPALSCGHCARAVTEAVQLLDREAKVAVEISSKIVRVETAAERPALVAALAEAGYPPD